MTKDFFKNMLPPVVLAMVVALPAFGAGDATAPAGIGETSSALAAEGEEDGKPDVAVKLLPDGSMEVSVFRAKKSPDAETVETAAPPAADPDVDQAERITGGSTVRFFPEGGALKAEETAADQGQKPESKPPVNMLRNPAFSRERTSDLMPVLPESIRTMAFLQSGPEAIGDAAQAPAVESVVEQTFSEGHVPAACCPPGPCCRSCCSNPCGCGSQPCGCGPCCEPCCDPCCCPPPCCVPTYWIGGVEATFFAPSLSGGSVHYRVEDWFASYPVDHTFGSHDSNIEDFYVAPRLWLGVQHGCCGVVARYWHMQAGEAAYDPFHFNSGSDWAQNDIGNFVHNRFEAYTVDLEVTQSFCCRDFKNIASFGVRHASLRHDAGLAMNAQISDGASDVAMNNGGARSNRWAYGTGFTAGILGRKPLFCNSCLHMVYGLRGSVVWGKVNNSAETWSTVETSGATAGSFNRAENYVNDSMFIGEALLGLEVDYRVMCFPADAFFRCALEYQYWDAASGQANATSFSGFGDPSSASYSQGQAFADADGLRLDLIGFTIASGFTW